MDDDIARVAAEIVRIEREIAATPARTRAGWAAKARLIRHQADAGAPIGDSGEEQVFEMVDSLIADLSGFD